MSVVKNIKLDVIASTSFNSYCNTSYLTSAIRNDTEKYVYVNENDFNEDIKLEEKGKYSVFDVANWFLLKGPMTHKKLQKLCYYAQAWCYAIKGYRLENTDFQAWVHGPVSPALWDRFKCFGMDTICIKNSVPVHIKQEDELLLEDVWDTYGSETGNALEVLTHRETPWIEARKGYDSEEKCTVTISPESMREFYKSIYSGV